MKEAELAVGTRPGFTMARESHPYSRLAVTAVAVFAAGYLLPMVAPGVTGRLMDGSLTRLMDIAQAIHSSRFDTGNALLLAFILAKNLLVAVIVLSAGDSMFGLPLIYVLLANGLSVGIVVYLLHAAAMPPVVIMAALLPHGVIELTALFVAVALGYSLRRRHVPLTGRLKAGLKTVLPLFVLAAVVEVYVTPNVVAAVLRMVG